MSFKNGMDDVLSQFFRKEFWVAILLIIFFSWITYILIQFCFLTDNILIDRQGTAAKCMPLTNNSVLGLFLSLLCFVFTAILMLGELQTYVDAKAQRDFRTSSKSLGFGVMWGLISVAIATGVMIFFNNLCFSF